MSSLKKPSQDLVPVSASDDDGGEVRVLGPSTNPATNLLIADIVLRGASSLFRKQAEKGIVKTSEDEQGARDMLDGRGILTTLALYGASKLATRSVPGLAIVAGGLLAKTLYDRGKSIELRRNARSKKKSGEPLD